MAHDHCDEIIEIVRDATSEPPDDFHLLGLVQLLLEMKAFFLGGFYRADVANDQREKFHITVDVAVRYQYLRTWNFNEVAIDQGDFGLARIEFDCLRYIVLNELRTACRIVERQQPQLGYLVRGVDAQQQVTCRVKRQQEAVGIHGANQIRGSVRNGQLPCELFIGNSCSAFLVPVSHGSVVRLCEN